MQVFERILGIILPVFITIALGYAYARFRGDSVMVITFNGTPSALKVLHFAHELAPALSVIVRSHDDADLDKLRAAGAAEVVPEAIEGSMMLASHALLMLGVPLRRVVHRIQAARHERYASLRGYFHGASDATDDAEHLHVRLHSVILAEDAYAIGKPLGALRLHELEAEVAIVRRGKIRIEVAPDIVLQAGDIVVLRGDTEAIALAEERLLR